MPGEALLTILGLLVVAAFALVVVLYLVGPLVFWWSGTIQATPEILAFDPTTTEMPPDVRSYFTVSHDALTGLGFEYVTTLSVPRYSSSDAQVFAVYVHREQLISASIAAHHGKVGARLQPAKFYLTFSSEFLDGQSLGTTNMPMLTMIRSRRSEQHQFPEVGDARRLLAIHVALIRRTGRALCGPEKLEESLADPIAEFRELYVDGFQALADRRFLRLSRDGETYRFTLRGAYHIVWSNSFPWSNVRRARLLREAEKTIADLEREGYLEGPASRMVMR
jgi:hypothetical protein